MGAWVPGCLGAWERGCLGAWVPGSVLRLRMRWVQAGGGRTASLEGKTLARRNGDGDQLPEELRAPCSLEGAPKPVLLGVVERVEQVSSLSQEVGLFSAVGHGMLVAAPVRTLDSHAHLGWG